MARSVVTARTIVLPRRWRLRYVNTGGTRTLVLRRRPDRACRACHGSGSVWGGVDPEDGESCPECWTPEWTLWPVQLRRGKFRDEGVPF